MVLTQNTLTLSQSACVNNVTLDDTTRGNIGSTWVNYNEVPTELTI